METEPPLSPREERILELFQASEDVGIEELFEKELATDEETTPRVRQQRVGAVVSLLNKKIVKVGYKIVPGVARRTYRLTKLED